MDQADVVTLSQTSPGFLRVCSTSLFKNTVEKGEIARNEPFLLFPLCFLPFWSIQCFLPFGALSAIFIEFKIVVCKLSIWTSLKFVVWERVKFPFDMAWLMLSIIPFNGFSFEGIHKIVGQKRNDCYQHFLLYKNFLHILLT